MILEKIDSSLYSFGSLLKKPAILIGREITLIFTRPFGEESKVSDYMSRGMKFIALVIVSLALSVLGPIALIGIGIQLFTHSPSSKASFLPSSVPLAVSPPPPPSSPLSSAPPALILPLDASKLKEFVTMWNDCSGSVTEEILAQLELQLPELLKMRDSSGPHAEFDQAVKEIRIQRDILDFRKELQKGYKIKEIEGDGNCWLNSALAGLTHLNLPTPVNHVELRKEVIAWIKENLATDPILRSKITSSMNDHYSSLVEKLNQDLVSYKSTAELYHNVKPTEVLIKTYDEKSRRQSFDQNEITEYLDKVSNIGSFGSHAELYALSKYLQVDIFVFKESLEKDCFPAFKVENPQARIAFLFVNNNHYHALLPTKQP